MAEYRPSLAVAGEPVQEDLNYHDDQRTSRKRRRTSGQAYSGEFRAEQRRQASLEAQNNQDEQDRIRPPHRSQHQNRSR
jgi:hypothetical protein